MRHVSLCFGNDAEADEAMATCWTVAIATGRAAVSRVVVPCTAADYAEGGDGRALGSVIGESE